MKYNDYDFQGKRKDQVEYSYRASLVAFIGLLVCFGYLIVTNLFN